MVFFDSSLLDLQRYFFFFFKVNTFLGPFFAQIYIPLAISGHKILFGWYLIRPKVRFSRYLLVSKLAIFGCYEETVYV